MPRAIQQGCNDKRKAEIVLKTVVEERARVSLLLQQLCGSVPLYTWGHDGVLLARPVTVLHEVRPPAAGTVLYRDNDQGRQAHYIH